MEIKKIEEIYSNKLLKQEDDIYKKQILLFTLIWIQRIRKHEFISAINWMWDIVQLKFRNHVVDKCREAAVFYFCIFPINGGDEFMFPDSLDPDQCKKQNLLFINIILLFYTGQLRNRDRQLWKAGTGL